MRLSVFLITVVVLFVNFKTVKSKMNVEQMKNTLKPYKNSCIRKTSVDVELVEGTKNGDFPSDQALMCFSKCVLQMMRVMKDGHVSLASMISQIDIVMPDELVEPMKRSCIKCAEIAAPFENPCENAFNFVKCFYETDSNLYFFP